MRDSLGHLPREPCPVAAELGYGAPQSKKQLPLRGRRPDFDQRSRPQDVFVDRSLDPPQGIGGKPGAVAGLEMRSRDDEAEIGLADQIGKRKIVSQVAPRDLCRQAEMAGDERVALRSRCSCQRRASCCSRGCSSRTYRLMRVAYSSTSSRGLPLVNVSRLSAINVVLWAFMGRSNPSSPVGEP
jgi:hypothetical protein